MGPFLDSVAKSLTKAKEDSNAFLKHYGDFTAFLHRQEFDLFLRKDALLFWDPSGQYLTFSDKDHWADKHPFNFPGPFYSGESDTCGTGVWCAPDNVMNDSYCFEYIFRQPASYYELLCTVEAATTEFFESYSSNGNDHWTHQACKEWWRNKEDLLVDLTRAEVAKMNNGQAQLYSNYLRGEAETDLRRYCYFLENGEYPREGNAALPTL
jgi:hypothetical protein